MIKLKVMSIFGTRPEAIKMAPIIKRLEYNRRIESIVTVTGQHLSMLDQVLDLFQIEADYNLSIMEESQTLEGITIKILTGLSEIFRINKPDLILVHGDTSTTFVSALAAFYHKLKVGHVEAGLRSHNKYLPYPEEMNRALTGRLADLHFAPTRENLENLVAEGVVEDNIFITGNTVIDALKLVVDQDYSFKEEALQNIDFSAKKVVVVTAHRRENLDSVLDNICQAVKEIAEENQDVEVVWPVHLNPRVKEKVYGYLDNRANIHLLVPLSYEEFSNLLARSYLIVTDSGGVQEEAPALDKPVIVTRDNTERKEAFKAGTIRLVGTEQEEIKNNILLLLKNNDLYQRMASKENPYGDGTASQIIVEKIIELFLKS